MLLLYVLLVSAVMDASCDVILPPEKAFQESKIIHNRMDRLENLVREQALLNRKQTEKLARQDNLNHQQTILNEKLAEQLAHQKTLNHQQTEELAKLSQRLTEQRNQLSQQSDQILQQNILIGQLKSSLSKVDASRLQQADLGKTLPEETFSQRFPADKALGNRAEWAPMSSGHTESVQKKHGMHEPRKAATSRNNYNPLLRRVSSRSDDYGALQVQVNQLGQRLSEVDALIQGLKNTDTLHTSSIQALESGNQQRDQVIQGARSSAFVRWGSSHCPNHSQLVYSGVVGGSWYEHSGAAVNYLCLTLSPIFSDNTQGGAFLYGGSYETGGSQHDRDPVCAVCRSGFSTTVMIPGTNVCTSGWTTLYAGYLMAGGYTHSSGSEYVCVDDALKSSQGSVHDDNGVLFYFTRTQCGSLPCEPYENDKIVTCVVCGK